MKMPSMNSFEKWHTQLDHNENQYFHEYQFTFFHHQTNKILTSLFFYYATCVPLLWLSLSKDDLFHDSQHNAFWHRMPVLNIKCDNINLFVVGHRTEIPAFLFQSHPSDSSIIHQKRCCLLKMNSEPDCLTYFRSTTISSRWTNLCLTQGVTLQKNKKNTPCQAIKVLFIDHAFV